MSGLKETWAVVEANDDFDNATVCSFEGPASNGLMIEVIAEIWSSDEEKHARLIAAAPTLLAALTKIAEGGSDFEWSSQECRGIARKAIAAAAGDE